MSCYSVHRLRQDERYPRSLLLGCFFVLCFTVFTPAFAQKPLKPYATGTQAASRLNLLFDEQELQGEYRVGQTPGILLCLTLNPDHRFTYREVGCLGEYERDSGIWKLDGDILVCEPSDPNRSRGIREMGVRFVPIKWNGSYLLVEENRMPGFCAEVGTRKSGTRLQGIHLTTLLKGTYSADMKGDPILPERYRHFYAQGMIVARVVHLYGEGRVILNQGKSEHVRPGMLFAIPGEGIELQVVSVSAHEAVAQARYYQHARRRVRVNDECATGFGNDQCPLGTCFARYPVPPGERPALR